MTWYDGRNTEHLTDSEFATMQMQWLCDRIANEMSWQIVEILIVQIWEKADLDQVIKKILTLEKKCALDIDTDLLMRLRSQFTGDSNIWRKPELFHIEPENFEKLHRGIKSLEKGFKLKNRNFKYKEMPALRAQYRRAHIMSKGDLALMCIKERYEIRSPEYGIKQFEEFVRQKLLVNNDLYKFIFRGKYKDFEEQSTGGRDAYITFKNVRNTANRLYRKKLERNPHYVSSLAKIAKIQSVIMSGAKKI